MANNIGILDPDGNNLNPLNNKPYSDTYKELAKKWKNYPAYLIKDEIIRKMNENQVILFISSTGSGKTVLMPKFMLHTYNYNGKIAVTLPKQIIAKSAAEFAAKTLDVELGKDVGYQYKGSEKNAVSENTKLLYATDGTIVARLMKDPLLKEFNAVIIDEAHERKVQIDFLLYLLRNTVINRPDFKLVIMSATVDSKIFESYFTGLKYASIEVTGQRLHNIDSIFLDQSLSKNDYLNKGLEIISHITKTDDLNRDGAHDILFFVTSINETFDICDKLAKIDPNGYCVEVYAGMDAEKQMIAQEKDIFKEKTGKKRKLVIATNVAESSLTIDGIKFVIDSGYELFSYYDPEKKAKVLEKNLITQAQAKQRMGRAGRTEAGVCYHLYTKDDFENRMKKFPEPTIRTSDITTECLNLLSTTGIETTKNIINVLSLFIEPPREIYMRSALTKLMQLGLLQDNAITNLGRTISDLQSDVELSMALFAGYHLNCLKEVSIIVAMIDACKGVVGELFTLPSDIIDENTNRDRIKFMMDKFKKGREPLKHKYGDHLSFLKIYTKYIKILDSDNESKMKEWTYSGFLKRSVLDKAHKYLRKIYYGTKGNLSKINKINIDGLMDYDIEYRILASIYFGYRLNTAYFNAKEKMYDTNNMKKVNINKESFMIYNASPRSKVFYHELFIGGNRAEINIVSAIPEKGEKLFNILRNKLLE